MVQCNQSFCVFLLSEGNFAFMQSYIHMYIACRIVNFARTRSTRDAARNNCLLCTRHALPQPPYPPPKKNPHLSRSPIAPLPLPPQNTPVQQIVTVHLALLAKSILIYPSSFTTGRTSDLCILVWTLKHCTRCVLAIPRTDILLVWPSYLPKDINVLYIPLEPCLCL